MKSMTKTMTMGLLLAAAAAAAWAAPEDSRFGGGSFDGWDRNAMANSAPAGGASILNHPVSGLTGGGATFNGLLVSTGQSACAVFVLWGTNTAAWANTNWFNGGTTDLTLTNGAPLSTNIVVTWIPDTSYYYTYGASNAEGVVVADSPAPFSFATLNVQATDATGRTAQADTVTFTVSRPVSGGALIVNYTLGGTASAGSEYAIAPASGTEIIAQGQTNGTIVVTPVWKPDPERTVTLSLAAGFYAIGAAGSATGTLAYVAAEGWRFGGGSYDGWDRNTMSASKDLIAGSGTVFSIR